jgi:hypothetical protein
VSWARPQWPGQAAPAWRRRGSPRYHRLTWRWSGSGAGGSRLSAAGSPIFSTPGVPPSPWALPDRCRARTPAGEVYGEGMKARVATVVGFVARLLSLCGGWRPAWRFGPTHACQGVGCRYCGVSVPGDGRGSCGRTLGRGIRPALNPLLRSARPTPRRDVTRARPPFALPRADEDNSRRYGYLRDLDRTLT